jgi:hypothetical protein
LTTLKVRRRLSASGMIKKFLTVFFVLPSIGLIGFCITPITAHAGASDRVKAAKVLAAALDCHSSYPNSNMYRINHSHITPDLLSVAVTTIDHERGSQYTTEFTSKFSELKYIGLSENNSLQILCSKGVVPFGRSSHSLSNCLKVTNDTECSTWSSNKDLLEGGDKAYCGSTYWSGTVVEVCHDTAMLADKALKYLIYDK